MTDFGGEMPVRVLLAEDHNIVREGVRAILSKLPDCDIVAEAADGHETVLRAEELEPDLIVMDVVMPRLNGIEAARKILSNQPDIRIVMLSMYTDSVYVEEALRAGVLAYLTKDCVAEDLVNVIWRVMAGEQNVVIGVEMFDDPREGSGPRALFAKLTPREREVLQLLAEGHSTKEAAYALGISAKTVESHRARLFTKLRCENVADLTRTAVREGLIDVQR